MTIDDDSGWGDHLLSATPAVDSGIAPEGLASKVVPVRSSHIERYEHDIPHRNCDGIIAPFVTSTDERPTGGPLGCANTVSCDGSGKDLKNLMESSASRFEVPLTLHPSDEGPSTSPEKVEHGDRSPRRTSTVRVMPRPSTREERIFAILVETFECPSDHAKLIAADFLSMCLQRGQDPIAIIVELSLKWRLVRHDVGACPIERLGMWLNANAQAFRPSPESSRASWAVIRQRIVDGARIGGTVKAADLRDYWDHCISIGKPHDAVFSQAIADLETAGLVSRHRHALSIHAEELRIAPRRKEEVTKEHGMEMVKAASIKAWGPDVWEQRLNELLCNLPWWRNMGGLALRGLADWVETL